MAVSGTKAGLMQNFRQPDVCRHHSFDGLSWFGFDFAISGFETCHGLFGRLLRFGIEIFMVRFEVITSRFADSEGKKTGRYHDEVGIIP